MKSNIVRLVRGILTIYLLIALVSLGFIGILIFTGVIDEPGVRAKTIVVDSSGNGNYLTIHEAVENASIGDTIEVWAGYYKENIEIYFSINLVGNGSGNTTIDGGNNWWYDPITVYATDVNISGFKIINSPDYGIEIFSSSRVRIHNNTITKNTYGIYISNSDNITIENNKIIRNGYVGVLIWDSYWNTIRSNNISHNRVAISLDWSQYHTISNNTMFTNGLYLSGDYLSYWTTHTIDSKNKVNGKPLIFWKNKNSGTVPAGAGQIILAVCSNVNVLNQNCSNCTTGIIIGHCYDILIDNNIFTINDLTGISAENSNNLTISNNKCDKNLESGLRLEQSESNAIHNNSFSYNENYGVSFYWDCYSNSIKNNICSYNNGTGIYLMDYNYYNKIEGNILSNNYNGIYLDWDASFNEITENTISFNTVDGVYIESWSFNNDVYHNNFISNSRQANDQSGSNEWEKYGEGNYWSDYTGVDNGAGGRTKGDGIGDTNIPHPSPGYDNHPFTEPFGWRYPGAAELLDPGDLDHDGNYTIRWENNPRAIGYILQEDESENFESPTELINGSVGFYNVSEKPEGTYYYRLKVYNQYYYSNWSETESIKVNYLPGIPRNFMTTIFSYGNTIYLSWELNQVDTNNYEIFYKTKGLSDWEILANLTHPNDTYLHKGLVDGQEYQYKIRSRDSYWQASPFSKIITGIPFDTLAPRIPTGLTAEAISDSKIKLTWNAVTDDDLIGYLIFMSDPTIDQEDEFKLIHKIDDKTITTFTVEDLNEQINYSFKIKAFDEVPNNSTFSEVAFTTTPDETHPQAPEGLEISNATHNSLTLNWVPNSEIDVIGYTVYHSTALSGDYINVTGVINTTNYIDTNLEENSIYYYKLKAVDDAHLFSLFSNYVYGFTKIGPKQPEINHSINDLELPEDTIDDVSINLFYLFKDANNDELFFRCEGQEHINVTIDQLFGSVTLEPDEDWNGEETLSFYATDGTHNWISYNITVTVTSENDAPGPAKIIKPINNLKIREDEKIDFIGICTDPDIPYGDELTFRWKSSISGEIGVGSNLSDRKLIVGEHLITLEVWDRSGKQSSDSINLDVLTKVSKSDEGFSMESWLYLSLALNIIIVILVVLVLFFRKRKKKPADNSGQVQTPVVGPNLQPELQGQPGFQASMQSVQSTSMSPQLQSSYQQPGVTIPMQIPVQIPPTASLTTPKTTPSTQQTPMPIDRQLRSVNQQQPDQALVDQGQGYGTTQEIYQQSQVQQLPPAEQITQTTPSKPLTKSTQSTSETQTEDSEQQNQTQ